MSNVPAGGSIAARCSSYALHLSPDTHARIGGDESEDGGRLAMAVRARATAGAWLRVASAISGEGCCAVEGDGWSDGRGVRSLINSAESSECSLERLGICWRM